MYVRISLSLSVSLCMLGPVSLSLCLGPLSLCLYVFVCVWTEVPSAFVVLRAFIDTAGLPQAQRLWLPVLLDALFEVRRPVAALSHTCTHAHRVSHQRHPPTHAHIVTQVCGLLPARWC
jgi:hypothetical protein